jgi:hypothetical protein
MIAKVRCLKCNELGQFDCGPDVTTVDQAVKSITNAHIQMCPFGHHVELADIEYEVIEMVEGKAPTDEAVIAEMEAKGYLCWDNTGDTPKGIEVKSFAMGFPIADCGGKPDFWMDFQTLPSGKRLWYCRKDDYEARMGPLAVPAEATA